MTNPQGIEQRATEMLNALIGSHSQTAHRIAVDWLKQEHRIATPPTPETVTVGAVERARLSHYPDYVDDPEGLERFRQTVIAARDRHEMAPVNLNSLARLIDTIDRLAALTTPAPKISEERALADACKPWADFHGDLPDYDHPLRCVFESGVQYAVELLAKTLKVEDYEVCDGTEEFDGDLGGTLFNIVLAALPKDEHGDEIHPCEYPLIITRAMLALASEAPQGVEERQHRFGSPPEPVANPSEQWCDAYADWYYQGKS